MLAQPSLEHALSLVIQMSKMRNLVIAGISRPFGPDHHVGDVRSTQSSPRQAAETFNTSGV